MTARFISAILKKRDSFGGLLPRNFDCLRRLASSVTAESANPLDSLSEEYLVQTRARIFGYRIGDGNRSGAKLLKKKLPIDKIKNYYPESPEDRDPFFEHPKIEKRQVKLAKLRRRGKGPPKKGEGRRSKGKAKKR